MHLMAQEMGSLVVAVHAGLHLGAFREDLDDFIAEFPKCFDLVVHVLCPPADIDISDPLWGWL